MQEYIGEITSTDPMLLVGGLAALVGLLLYYLYGGFIHENYTRIKWLRRLFLPHITHLIRKVDKQSKSFDLSAFYVETSTREREHSFDLYLREEAFHEQVVSAITKEMIDNHFRPEVLLASLGTGPDGEYEIGNYVLTAPEKKHANVPAFGRMYDILLMFVSKYQLHVRVYYDADRHRFRFYAHYELNPYNPFYAMKHYKAREFDPVKGARMFKEYKDDIAKYGVEVLE